MSRSGAVYTHGHDESVLRSHRWRTAQNSAAYLLDSLRGGQAVLDVGCGPATITADLAQLVRPGVVTAAEITEPALDLARAEIARRGIDNVRFELADVHALPFADASFDVVHAHQVLQHVGDPVQALREMRRVCRPGGVVAARDGDYHGFTWYPEIGELDEWMVHYQWAARENGGEPDAGRRLLGWARRAGFSRISATSSTWCLATAEDRQWWGGMWADRILGSDIARQLVGSGRIDRAGLERISRAWRSWAADEDGWMSILHGEVLCTP